MTSPKKTEANRRNALASTGPRTPEGKAASSRNALRWGLLSREALLPDERREELRAFRERLVADLAPVGELEEFLADRVVSSAWRLRRALAVEVGLFMPERKSFADELLEGLGRKGETEETEAERLAFRFDADACQYDAFPKLARYEAALERSLYRALHELERLQASRAGRPVLPPAVLDVDFSVSGAEGAEG